MATYYVATNGSNSAIGSAAAPWKSINYAVQSSVLKPGDTVIVKSGTYTEAVSITRSGSASADITLKSEVPGGAKIVTPSNGGFGINVGANYVTVDGFDVTGAADRHGIQANNTHHVSILNNTVHGAGASGIQFNWSDFVRIEGNETYGNAYSGWFSGISLYENQNITGDSSTDGYRNIIRNNVSHDNITKSGAHTDGNGIILDDFHNGQVNGQNYQFKTLID